MGFSGSCKAFLKPLRAWPIAFPTSGSFPGPNRTRTIMKMTSSSGRPISPSMLFFFPQCEENRVVFALHQEEYALALCGACHSFSIVRQVSYRLAIDLANDIARLQAGFVARAIRLYGRDHDSLRTA